jgi:hypothetical protein
LLIGMGQISYEFWNRATVAEDVTIHAGSFKGGAVGPAVQRSLHPDQPDAQTLDRSHPFTRGEISDLTSLIYDAREHAIGLIRDEANAIGADDVVGIKTHIHEHGSLLEFMAIGTAVKKQPGLTTLSPTLPPQAVIQDKETWIGEDAIQIDRAENK